MAHDLNVHNGQHSFASLREPAWHGFGQILNAPVSDKEWLKLAGLDYKVNKVGLYRQDMETVASHFAIVRSDNQKTLGVVTAGYEPMQNHELMDWIRGLDGFCDVTIETAGALGMGETVFISARCDGLKFDIGGDEHKGYMLLSNGHVGNRRLMINPTGTRVVCANTLAMATGHMSKDENKGFALSGNLSSGFALRHTKNIRDMMADIQAAYIRTTEAWKATEQVMRSFAAKPLTDEMLAALFTKPFEKPKSTNKDAEKLAALLSDEQAATEEAESEGVRAKAIAAEREKRLREIHESETCQRFGATKNTLFSGFQAVTEYITHEMPVRTGEGDTKGSRRRFESNLMDRGDQLKRATFKVAMELLEA